MIQRRSFNEKTKKIVLTLLVDVAQELEVINGLIFFGSLIQGDLNQTSDIDACFVINNEADQNLIFHRVHQALLQHFSISFIQNGKKQLIFLSNKNQVNYISEIIDLYIVKDLNEIKYLLNSTYLAKECIKQMIKIDKTGSVSRMMSEIASERNNVSDEDSLKRQVNDLIFRFIESISNAVRSIFISDRYKYLFHLFIAYHSIITLTVIKNGKKNHLYLPKKAFEQMTIQERSILESLEPNGNLSKASILLPRYIRVFLTVITEIYENNPTMINGDLKAIKKILEMNALQVLNANESHWSLFRCNDDSRHSRDRNDLFHPKAHIVQE